MMLNGTTSLCVEGQAKRGAKKWTGEPPPVHQRDDHRYKGDLKQPTEPDWFWILIRSEGTTWST